MIALNFNDASHVVCVLLFVDGFDHSLSAVLFERK